MRAFRRTLGREGMLPVYVRRGEGKAWEMWKMDVKDGWLLEGGTPLERLVSVYQKGRDSS